MHEKWSKHDLQQETIDDLLKAKEDHYRGYLTDEQYIETVDSIVSYYVDAFNKGATVCWEETYCSGKED